MSERSVAVIVGLGNPGPEYAETRHNAGFWFVDRLARRLGSHFREESRYAGAACRVTIAGHSVFLLKPSTYMNRSGRSVAALLRFYKFSSTALLVAHDELDLSPGVARLKSGGGHGGHNGLRDIAAHLGDNAFLRLRLGIGHPGTSAEVTSYVLHRPSAIEREQIDTAIDAAFRVIEPIVSGDLSKAMNDLHARAAPPS